MNEYNTEKFRREVRKTKSLCVSRSQITPSQLHYLSPLVFQLLAARVEDYQTEAGVVPLVDVQEVAGVEVRVVAAAEAQVVEVEVHQGDEEQ